MGAAGFGSDGVRGWRASSGRAFRSHAASHHSRRPPTGCARSDTPRAASLRPSRHRLRGGEAEWSEKLRGCGDGQRGCDLRDPLGMATRSRACEWREVAVTRPLALEGHACRGTCLRGPTCRSGMGSPHGNQPEPAEGGRSRIGVGAIDQKVRVHGAKAGGASVRGACACSRRGVEREPCAKPDDHDLQHCTARHAAAGHYDGDGAKHPHRWIRKSLLRRDRQAHCILDVGGLAVTHTQLDHP
jgi:hypothetical protein